jgi:hypothetical protein
MLSELGERHGALEGRIEGRIAEVVGEFSLDDESSALSRLVRSVERAQRTITAEFSLDNETSALSRMAKQLDRTTNTLEAHLSLDNDASALSRLRRELMTVVQSSDESNRRLLEEVKVTIGQLVARREEAARSPAHGFIFQDEVFAAIERLARSGGDIIEDVANRPGIIARCKKGDAVVTLGSEHVAAGARIVIESKDDAGYKVTRVLEEMQQARNNREASLGLFVLSSGAAPDGTPGFARPGHGDDVIIVYNPEDPATDIRLETAFEVCRSLAARRARKSSTQGAALDAIEQEILGIEHCLGGMDEIETLAQTVENNGKKILSRVQKDRAALADQIASLRDHTAALRAGLAGEL